MGAWYWIGVSAGLGAAAGVFIAGVSAKAVAVAVAVAAAAGIGIGFAVDALEPGGWGDILAGAIGAPLAGYGAAVVVRGALRRGGTRAGTAILVAGGALVAAGIAFVPLLGYLMALGLPAFAIRLRRRQPERYAGLRTLAK